MSMSSLWFCVLLLLRAILAQSAPNGIIYPGLADEDEEELIDKLATYVAMGGKADRLLGPSGGAYNRGGGGGGRAGVEELPLLGETDVFDERELDFNNNNNNNKFSDFDLPPLDYVSNAGAGGGERDTLLNADDLMLQQSLKNLPKQFAYKPDDIRFYMNPDEFPNYNSNSPAAAAAAATTGGATLKSSGMRQDQQPSNLKPNNINIAAAREERPILMNEDILPIISDAEHDRNQEPPHMKKSQQQDVPDAKDDVGVFEPAVQAAPGNVLASVHALDKPGGPFVTSFVDGQSSFSMYYVALIAALSSAGVVGLVGAGICWYRIHERVKAAAEVDYPAYGVTGPSKDVSPTGGDRKLAQSAHMYHYQHQKQQMAALQKSALEGGAGSGGAEKAGSDVESEDDNEDGDYTVYECPGLAPAGDMEVKNPLFEDEPTPATPSQLHTELATAAATEEAK